MLDTTGTMGQELEGLKARHPSVGDVRYIGLFSAVELVKDRATREPMVPFNAAPAQGGDGLNGQATGVAPGKPGCGPPFH